MRNINKKLTEYRVIGLMSGTSMDGLDIAYCVITYLNGKWNYAIENKETIPYNLDWLKNLQNARSLSEQKISELDEAYGSYLANCVTNFIKKYQISTIDFIASHGHTVHHRPQEGFTQQIGDGEVINRITKIPVVYDFRTQDVKLGGQGAPLVPIGDKYLFPIYDACLNLGGFANISFDFNGERMAFDICPVNSVLNYFSRKLGKEYDENGEMAREGELDLKILQSLNNVPFYALPIPKSLGIEWVEDAIFPILESRISVADILHTFSVHSAQQILAVFKKYELKKVLVTGGGAYNQFFIDLLKSDGFADIFIPEPEIIEYKEALVFAFLGVLRWRNEINILQSVTGATRDHCSGKIAKLYR